MKKTRTIRLILITALLAGCNRPLYQQRPESGSEQMAGTGLAGDEPDSNNACPILPQDMPPDYYTWYYCFRPYTSYYEDPWLIDGLYDYNLLYAGSRRVYGSGAHAAVIVRRGFGHSARTVHS